MEIIPVSKAKAGLNRIGRRVIKTRKAVVVRFPTGFVQIAPFDLPEEVPPAPLGSYKPTKREIQLGNTFGVSL
jgi:hypothetical protein